jgi:hypothetical protein
MICRDWVGDQGRRRHGRFIFYQGPHRALLQNGGNYHFAVYRQRRDNIISEMEISAREIENRFGLSQIRQKAIPWVTIFSEKKIKINEPVPGSL